MINVEKLVTRIQCMWKNRIKIDIARKELLKRLWDKTYEDLVNESQANKRNQIKSKPTFINLTIREKLLNEHYNAAKNVYLRELAKYNNPKWNILKKSMTKKNVKLPGSNKSSKKCTKRDSIFLNKALSVIISKKKPIFKYKPSKMLLMKLIKKAIDK